MDISVNRRSVAAPDIAAKPTSIVASITEMIHRLSTIPLKYSFLIFSIPPFKKILRTR
jgi:hypothetical protein